MSFRAVLWVLKQDLRPVRKLVLVAIASHADKYDHSCFPKVRTIAKEASLDPRSVHRHLRELERAGLVRIEKKYRGKGRQPNTYWLNMPPEPATRGMTPCDSRVADKRNHYSNHKKEARQDTSVPRGQRSGLTIGQQREQQLQNELAKRLGRDGWEVLAAFPEKVPLLTGKLQRGTLKQSDLVDLRARFTLQGGAA
jgi:DNA-binding transcriptional ArsR family regulator